MTNPDGHNRVAVVTGGGGGIGRAVVERLCAEGSRVVVGDIDLDTVGAAAMSSVPVFYDPAEGDPGSNIAPGTPFESLPAGWSCPDCGAMKADFEPIDD